MLGLDYQTICMYLLIIFEIKCNSDYVLLALYYWYNFHLDNYKRQRSTMSPSTDWLSYLRTQLRAFVDGVCLQIRVFFLFFSNTFFHLKLQTLFVLQLKGNLFICTQIWTVACLINKSTTKNVCNNLLFISKSLFKTDFCMITSAFFNPFSKMF